MSKIENIKNHFKNNKVTYIACGVTAVVVAGVTYYVVGTPATTNAVVGTQIIQNIKQGCLNWKSNQVVVNLVENSTPSTPVGILGEDGTVKQVFNSISEASRELGIDKSIVSKIVNGKREAFDGVKMVPLQKAA